MPSHIVLALAARAWAALAFITAAHTVAVFRRRRCCGRRCCRRSLRKLLQHAALRIPALPTLLLELLVHEKLHLPWW
jgi:hypothetical protein